MQRKLEILDGAVVYPELHDAEILGMMLGEGNLVLTIRLIGGDLINLNLRRVYRLIANGFREGNLILDMEIAIAEEVCLDDVQMFYASRTSDSALFLLEKVKVDKKIVVKISSSYGCEIACICDEISF
jgi:hypothetical protein